MTTIGFTAVDIEALNYELDSGEFGKWGIAPKKQGVGGAKTGLNCPKMDFRQTPVMNGTIIRIPWCDVE